MRDSRGFAEMALGLEPGRALMVLEIGFIEVANQWSRFDGDSEM